MHATSLPDWKSRAELHALLDLSDPPKDFFFMGNWDEGLFKSCVAIVGSRRMTDYGRAVVERIVPQLVTQGKTIVSGFMYGVDQFAHEVCIASGGRTIAVLGWGIEYPLEYSDGQLADKIVHSGGLLISEWKNQKPALWTFPVRNRIVAALAQEVIVVEAAAKSGSLITARLANELHRKLWAVPGPITSHVSEGTNTLIHDGVAELWTTQQQRSVHSTSPIVELVQNEALSADEIARKLGESVADIGAQLSMLLLTGVLSERGGKYYAR